MNIPAVVILGLLSALLIRGTRESAFVNSLIVVIKVTIVLMVIVIGWGYINPANHTPLIPEATTYITPQGVTHNYGGIMGILGAAGVVFFAYIGFDAVSTAAQEAKNPKRDMPIGILGSLVICTVLYVLFSYVLSGVATVEDFRSDRAAKRRSRSRSRSTWPATNGCRDAVTVAILAGFSSVILVMLLGQSRVFYAMSRDGLVPKVFSEIHPVYKTPHKSNMLFFVFTAAFAAFVPGDIVGEMTSIGTLFAFMLVCAGVWIMRVRRPDLPRGFTVPAIPVVATLGIVTCGAMIYGLGWTNWLRLAAWLAVGLVIYFAYSKKQQQARGRARADRLRAETTHGMPCSTSGWRGARGHHPRRAAVRRSATFRARAGRPPALDIVLVGDDPASDIYVGAKERAGQRLRPRRHRPSAAGGDLTRRAPDPRRHAESVDRLRRHPRPGAAACGHGTARGAAGLRRHRSGQGCGWLSSRQRRPSRPGTRDACALHAERRDRAADT